MSDARVPVIRTAVIMTLKFFSRLESNSLAEWNRDFLAGARVTADAALARLDDEDTKSAQLIRSPRDSASFIELKSASTACSAFSFGIPVSSASRLMMSSLITSVASSLCERFADFQVGKAFEY